MKIAFCLKENSFTSDLDGRFGRAEYYGLVESDTGEELVVLENTAKTNPSGAGSAAVQLLVNNKVEMVIAPEFGPKAFDALKKFEIKTYKQGNCKNIAEALKAFRTGTLDSPAAPGHGGLHKA